MVIFQSINISDVTFRFIQSYLTIMHINITPHL